MKRYLLVLAVFVASIGFMAVPALAHPGRTDKRGGHFCRTNCTEKWGVKYGSYHYHSKKNVKTTKSTSKKSVKKVKKSAKMAVKKTKKSPE